MVLRTRLRAVLQPARDGEAGFTIIEVLVAAFILVLGALAIFMTFAAAIHNVQRSRESQIGISVAQREVERIRVIPFDSIRLTTSPSAPSVPNAKSPFSRIAVIGGVRKFNVVRDTTKPTQYQSLLVPTGAPAQPVAEVDVETPGVRSSDGTEVTVYRFVTCEEEIAGRCVAKRLIVDVLATPKANLSSYQRNYTELQSTIVDTGGAP
jgi:hypothetical protein